MSAETLIAYQKSQKAKVIAAIQAAQATIEKEIEQDGYYKRNGCRLTLLELALRAGVGASTLKNKTHEETLSAARKWLKGIKARLALQKAASSEGGKPEGAEKQLLILSRKFDVFKVLFESKEQQVIALEEDNASLRAQLADCKRQNLKVVPVRPGE